MIIPARPAPATARYANELQLRVLHAMSTDERITIRLHDGREHVGQIVRRTTDGLVLDAAITIRIQDAGAITTAPPRRPSATARTGVLRRAHNFGYRGHCLSKSRGYSIRFKDL